ncbi:MAG: mechanosensitive ion channel family protein [Xenophilus sp.]
MNRSIHSLRDRLPPWALDWLDVLVPALQVALIVLAAWLLMQVVRRLIRRLAAAYALPAEVVLLSRRTVGFVVYGGALLWCLERLGVSGGVLWTAFTGFAAVGAVAFFAAWSVLSNIFCAILIFTTRAFRLGDLVELVEAGDKPGLKGRVADINLVYTTLVESGDAAAGTTLQLPNSLFFQRALRRWHGGAPLPGLSPAPR